jgi:multicomponent Na+:H+ antiporter subunit G
MQAAGLCGTTAIFSTCMGALILAPSLAIALRILVIMVFFLISAPTGSYIVARYIWQSGAPTRSEQNRIADNTQREQNL